MTELAHAKDGGSPDRSVASVKNVVQNLDGTISALPPLMCVDADGWWLTDGSIYWRANTKPKSELAQPTTKGEKK